MYSHNYVKEKLYLVVFPVLFRCNFVSLAERVKQAWPWWSSWYWTARNPKILDLYLYPSLKDDFKQATCNLIGLRLQPKPHRENRFANNKYTKSLKNTYCLKNFVLYPNIFVILVDINSICLIITKNSILGDCGECWLLNSKQSKHFT